MPARATLDPRGHRPRTLVLRLVCMRCQVLGTEAVGETERACTSLVIGLHMPNCERSE